jgi:hypothetical protein
MTLARRKTGNTKQKNKQREQERQTAKRQETRTRAKQPASTTKKLHKWRKTLARVEHIVV